MGSPGAGKTTVGRILGDHLGKEIVDVDDDVLESMWGMAVAEKVSFFPPFIDHCHQSCVPKCHTGHKTKLLYSCPFLCRLHPWRPKSS